MAAGGMRVTILCLAGNGLWQTGGSGFSGDGSGVCSDGRWIRNDGRWIRNDGRQPVAPVPGRYESCGA